MDRRQDLRHNVQPINNFRTTNTTNLKRITLITLFIVQFLLPQLVLSYGIYAIYFVEQNISILDALWPPILYIATTKLSSPWLQAISESLYEYNSRCLFFIGTAICSTGVALCYFFVRNTLICGVFYGVFGGLGSSLISSLLNCHLFDIFQHQSHIVLGIHHLGLACGLFTMPLIIQHLIEFSSISYVFLIQGAILLHILPAGLLLGRKRLPGEQRLTAYNNLGTNETYDEEMVEMSHTEQNLSLVSRNWKSPSDKSDNFEDHEYVDIDELANASPKISSPLPTHKTDTGVSILPLIIEEDENETDDENVNISKRSSMLLDNNLKRMSVISVKLEEFIQKEEETTILEVKPTEENKTEVLLKVPVDEPMHISLAVDENLNRQNTKSCCCTPYQKYRFRRRIKSCFDFIFKLFLKPLIKSIQVIEFYPALFTNVHSMLSPLIFLNFAVFRARSVNEELNIVEISFMYPITAFAYLVFLITLPWISKISKRNLKYVYILGCMISASGTYMCAKNQSEDYLIISCLIYGLGFGIESYLKETVLRQFLGVRKWSSTENTLETLSAILFIAMILVLRNIFGTENNLFDLRYSEIWLDVIFCNHLIVCSIWLMFPLINYLFDSLFYRNRGKYTFT